MKGLDKRYRLGKEDGLLDSHFVSCSYFELRFGAGRQTIVERVLEDLAARLHELGPTCLKFMAASYATFYQVVDPGPEVIVLEELGTGRRCTIASCSRLPQAGETFGIPASWDRRKKR